MVTLKSEYIERGKAGEELGIPIQRIIDLINEGALRGYARIQHIPPDHAPWHKVDKEKHSMVRVISITGIPGSDDLFCEHELTDDSEKESYISLEDLWFKSTEIERLKLNSSRTNPVGDAEMKYPELEYMSMVEATRKFPISIEHLRGLIEQKLLPAYVREGSPLYRYAKIKAPYWEGDTLPLSMAEILDEAGDPIAPDECVMYPAGFSYGLILVRPEELRALEQGRSSTPKPCANNKAKVPLETPEQLTERLKSKDKTDKEIAKVLKQAYPDISTFKIGSLLPAKPGATIEPGSISTRGRRLLK